MSHARRSGFRGVTAALGLIGAVPWGCYQPTLVDCVVECGADGACPHSLVCSNGWCASSADVCELGTAAPVETVPESCEPGVRRCRTFDQVEECTDRGVNFVLGETCGADRPVCQGGACVACAPGALRCVDATALQRCTDSGTWEEGVTRCSEFAPRCAGNACVPSVQIAAGGGHACAITARGTVRCWGDNAFGQLGVGDRAPRGTAPDALPLADVALGPHTVIGLSAGQAHTCALLEGGDVRCWGANGNGQLGLGDRGDRGDELGEMGESLPSVDLGTGAVALAVTAGDRHTCALLENGRIACWGANESGQLGVGDRASRGGAPEPSGAPLPNVDLGPEAHAIAVEAGHNHTCALLADGTIKCWGENEHGQLGLGDRAVRGDDAGELGDLLPAVALEFGVRAVRVSAGGNHSCAVLEDGSVVCWGSNSGSQLGTGDRVERGVRPAAESPSMVAVDLGTEARVLEVSAGSSHSCALLASRNIKCWGANGFGQLGVGDRAWRGEVPSELGDALPSVDLGGDSRGAMSGVSAGLDFTCAVSERGIAKCWGQNQHGQLGVGATDTRGDEPFELGDVLPAIELD